MERKRLALAGVVIVAMLSTITTACSGSSSGSDSNTLTYWASNQGTSINNDTQVLRPVLKDFTKKTGVKVKLEVIGWNDLQTRIQTAVTSGQSPDVVNIGNTWASSLQATGAFLPFDSDTMKKIGGKDKFVSTAMQTGGARGKDPTSVPLYGLAYGLYYNKKMFADAGLQPPSTWEELVSDASTLTQPSKNVYGFSVAGASYTENIHFAFITAAQNGGDFFNADGEPTFTSKPIVQGIKRYLDLMQSSKVVKPSNAQYDDASKVVNDFATKKAAMMLVHNPDASLKADGMSADEYGVAAFPAPAGGKKIASFPAGINMSVFKNTDNKEAALKFVKYMTSKSVQRNLDKKYGALPVLQGVEPNFTSNTAEAKTYQNIYNNMSKPLPLVPAEDQFESTVGKAMNSMFAKIATGGTISTADIRASLKTAQNQVKQTVG